MKRTSFLAAAILMAMSLVAHAQDPAVEERLKKLSGQIDDLIAARDVQNKRIEELSKEISALQATLNRPNTYASHDDLKQLAAKMQEIDEKRQQDNERILKEIEKLGKTLVAPQPKKQSPTTESSSNTGTGYEYVIQPGDTISAIVQAYREKNIKVTIEQVLKANDGLKPEKLVVGKKIWIPAPQ